MTNAPGLDTQLRVGLRPKLLRRRETPFRSPAPGCALAFGQSFCGVAGLRSGVLLLER